MKPEVGMRVNVRTLIEDGWHVLYQRTGRPKLYLISLADVNENYLPNEVVEIVHIHGQTSLLDGTQGDSPVAKTLTQLVEVVAAPEGAILE
jgi:hypothetical protein